MKMGEAAPFASKIAVGLACGLLFGLGLGLSGMTRPERVIGFLDVFGAWDPTLLFVMGGAIAVHMPFALRARRQGMFLPDIPCGGAEPALPNDGSGAGFSGVDRRTLIGSAVFGVGWGLGGYCPGPAVVALATGALPVLVFLGAMLLGIAVRSSRRV
jgi:hypothetical protein